MRHSFKILLLLTLSLIGVYFLATYVNINPSHSVGEKLDSFNGVAVYYNGGIHNTSGRTITQDGYNLGLKYQCVEFVKRYYFERFNHRMPNVYGHAKDFFSEAVVDGALNHERMLVQYRNGGSSSPQIEDIIVFRSSFLNRYGHVAIISQVGDDFIEIIQQNAGPFGSTRMRLPFKHSEGTNYINDTHALGWLRRE